MAIVRHRVWSVSNERGIAYVEFEVDDVAEEALAVVLFNSTGDEYFLTYRWKNKPQPDTFTLPAITSAGDPPESAEISFAIPPGQRKWVVLPDGEFDTELDGSEAIRI